MLEKNLFPVGIVGLGVMGSSIGNKMIGSMKDARGNIYGYDIDPLRREAVRETTEILVTDDIDGLIDKAECLIVAIKPDYIGGFLITIKNKVIKDTIIISIAVGVKLQTLRMYLGDSCGIARIMPNIGIKEGISPIAFVAEKHIQKERVRSVKEMLSTLGEVFEVEEPFFDAFTAISGSGIAFVFLILEGMQEAGVRLGLPSELSKKIAIDTLLGAGMLAKKELSIPFYTFKEAVTTPRGTTIEGLYALERSGMKGILMEAFYKVYLRSIDIANSTCGG